jgi:hypothetical protein
MDPDMTGGGIGRFAEQNAGARGTDVLDTSEKYFKKSDKIQTF